MWKYCVHHCYRFPSILKMKSNQTPTYFCLYIPLQVREKQGARRPVLSNNSLGHFAELCTLWKTFQQVNWLRLSLKYKVWRNWGRAVTGSKVKMQSNPQTLAQRSNLLGKKRLGTRQSVPPRFLKIPVYQMLAW